MTGYTMPELGPIGRALARNVRQLRQLRSISQTTLTNRMSEHLGYQLHKNWIYKFEYGERRPDADQLVALAKALDVALPALLRPDLIRLAPAPREIGRIDGATLPAPYARRKTS